MKRILVGLLFLGMIVSGVACVSSSGSLDDQGEIESTSAYNTVKDTIQNAVIGYATNHNGNFPLIYGYYSVGQCTNCQIIDIKALLYAYGGMLTQVPDGIYAASGVNNDNCDGGANGCSSSNHYVWLIDSYGNVYSKCMGSDCNSNDASGYQDIWP